MTAEAPAGSLPPAAAGGVTVVIGPRTRLGRELITRARARGEDVIAVARHQRDVDDLSVTWESDAGVRIVRGAALLPSSSPADADVAHAQVVVPAGAKLFICALGPVQSEDRVDDPAVVRAEVEVVRAALAAGKGRAVLVSSVLALAPKPERRHYAGWKNVVEEWVRKAAAEHGATLSVLYPGRLVDGGAQKNFRVFVHTPYPKLASVVERVSDQAHIKHGKTVGIDARLWLLARGARLASGAPTGSAA